MEEEDCKGKGWRSNSRSNTTDRQGKFGQNNGDNIGRRETRSLGGSVPKSNCIVAGGTKNREKRKMTRLPVNNRSYRHSDNGTTTRYNPIQTEIEKPLLGKIDPSLIHIVQIRIRSSFDRGVSKSTQENQTNEVDEVYLQKSKLGAGKRNEKQRATQNDSSRMTKMVPEGNLSGSDCRKGSRVPHMESTRYTKPIKEKTK